MVPVVFPQHFDNIFADVMNVAFDYGQYDGVARRGVGAGSVSFCGCCCVVLRSTPLHLLFNFVKGCFCRIRRHQQLGQEQCLFAKPFPYRVQRRNNKLIDDFQRRFLFFQQSAVLCWGASAYRATNSLQPSSAPLKAQYA